MMYDSYEFDRQIRAERNHKRKGEMSANEWRFNDSGSADPKACSFETIFAAYHDYRNSQQWN